MNFLGKGRSGSCFCCISELCGTAVVSADVVFIYIVYILCI